MNQHKNDTSQNDFSSISKLQWFTVSKAYHKQSTRDESIDKAASHLEQALNLYAAKKPEEVDTSLFGIGGAYEIVADLSQKDKCLLYGKARSAFGGQLPLIKGDSYTAYGKTVALEPLRAEIQKYLISVDDKSAKASSVACASTPTWHFASRINTRTRRSPSTSNVGTFYHASKSQSLNTSAFIGTDPNSVQVSVCDLLRHSTSECLCARLTSKTGQKNLQAIGLACKTDM